jgi:hypothetical protein
LRTRSGCRRADITRQRRVRHVQVGVRSSRIPRTRSQQDPGARLVNRIASYGGAASGGWRALTIHVDAGLRAAIDNVRLRRIPIAAKIDGIEELGTPDMIQPNDRAVGSERCRRRRGDNSKLRALHRIAGDGYVGRAVNQDPGGSSTRWGTTRWVYVDVVNYVVGCDFARRPVTYLNAVLGDDRSGA